MSGRKDEQESSNLGAPQKKPRICGKPNKDEQQAELDKELSVLAPSRIPLERFTVDALWKKYLLVPQFLKMVRVITHLADFAVIKLILEWGASRGIFSSESDMTVGELVALCTVLRKPEGQAAVTAHQRRVKLERKAGTCSTSASSMALSKILMIQLQDYSIRVKRLKKEGNGAGDKAESKQKIMSEELAVIDAEMVPASKYAALLPGMVQTRAVEKYEAAAKAQGVAVPEDKDSLLYQAVKVFGQSVMTGHMIKFCEQEGVKDQLVAYARKKISELDAGWERRRANRLRDTLACVDVGSSDR